MSETPRKKEVLDDIEKYKSIQAILNQEGGKILQDTAYRDVKNSIDILAQSYKTASHADLVTLCATLKASLDLLRVFRNAKTNQELAEEALKHIEE
jgi:hypothetical protein